MNGRILKGRVIVAWLLIAYVVSYSVTMAMLWLMHHRENIRLILITQAVGYGMPLLLVSGILLLNEFLRGTYIWRTNWLSVLVFLFFFGWMGAVGSFVGLLHGNSVNYIVGDGFKAVSIPLAMYVTVKLCRDRTDCEYVLSVLVAALFISLVPFCYSTMKQLFSIIEIWKRTNPIRHELVYIYCFILFLVNTKFSKKVCYLTLCSGVFFINRLSLSRAGLILSCFISIFIVIMLGRNHAIRSSGYILVGFFLAISVAFVVPGLKKRTNIIYEAYSRRLSHVSITKNIDRGQEMGRVLEVQNAYAHYKKESDDVLSLIGHTLLGMGAGAEYEVAWTTHSRLSRFVGEDLHHIHNGFFNLFFRYGLIGLLLFNLLSFYIIGRSFRLFLRVKMRNDLNGMIFTLSILSYYICDYVNFITTPNMLKFMPWGVLFGLFSIYENNIYDLRVYIENDTIDYNYITSN